MIRESRHRLALMLCLALAASAGLSTPSFAQGLAAQSARIGALGDAGKYSEAIPLAERERWLELLSYIVAMVYHDRAESEREGLRERVVASVRTDEWRQEIAHMIWTGADQLRHEGRLEGRVEGRSGGPGTAY